MPAGQTPYTIILFAHNDLVDKVQPGDRVNITGKEKKIDSLTFYNLEMGDHNALGRAGRWAGFWA